MGTGGGSSKSAKDKTYWVGNPDGDRGGWNRSGDIFQKTGVVYGYGVDLWKGVLSKIIVISDITDRHL